MSTSRPVRELLSIIDPPSGVHGAGGALLDAFLIVAVAAARATAGSSDRANLPRDSSVTLKANFHKRRFGVSICCRGFAFFSKQQQVRLPSRVGSVPADGTHTALLNFVASTDSLENSFQIFSNYLVTIKRGGHSMGLRLSGHLLEKSALKTRAPKTWATSKILLLLLIQVRLLRLIVE
ncbi:hypothetical protein EVAR_56966_1 [Eumeta japonica]|uniref:Uncharacterized protein n=1 Tax=Eumeta variegata TaxID=151549 RepID=A0A4C1YQ07_EUMVA|nr:hypothetical protein EVAR_56966_1 [Eumeta japonica]